MGTVEPVIDEHLVIPLPRGWWEAPFRAFSAQCRIGLGAGASEGEAHTAQARDSRLWRTFPARCRRSQPSAPTAAPDTASATRRFACVMLIGRGPHVRSSLRRSPAYRGARATATACAAVANAKSASPAHRARAWCQERVPMTAVATARACPVASAPATPASAAPTALCRGATSARTVAAAAASAGRAPSVSASRALSAPHANASRRLWRPHRRRRRRRRRRCF